MVVVTSSYKTRELTFVRQKIREIEALREKIMYKGEFGDMKGDTLKKKSRYRKNGFTNRGQTRKLRD